MKSFHRRTAKPAPVPGHHAAPTRQRSGVRLDQLLVEQGLAASRTTARRMIEAGRVSYLGETQSKPAQELPADAALQVVADGSERYVSRGGLKLAGALAHSGLDVSGWDCLDVGQSTGGFTDCLLQAGAAQVVGVDVGHDQLHTRLRGDPRVSCLQHINCRTLTREDLGIAMPRSKFDLIVADLSFISLTLVLPQLPPLLKLAGEMLLLVKPQFEVGPQGIGKGGLVRDPALYVEVEAKLRQCAADLHLRALDWFDSPITGGDGNREFFLRLEHENRTLD